MDDQPGVDERRGRSNASDAADFCNDNEGLVCYGEDLLALQDLDRALNEKMHLVNNVRSSRSIGSTELGNADRPRQAIDEIGFTPYHWKLFLLNGFG